MAHAGGETDREITGLIPRCLLSYVRQVLGDDAAAEVVARAGLGERVAMLDDAASWFRGDEVIRLAEAAAEVCGDADIGRRMGEELMFEVCASGLSDFITAQGTVLAGAEMLVTHGMKMSADRSFHIVEVGDEYLVVEAIYETPLLAHARFCSMACGALAALPGLFGKVGRATELTCQLRGADVCRFRMSWVEDPRGLVANDQNAAVADARTERELSRFEALQAMASELVAVGDIEEALDRICDRATLALEAPRFLLAVRAGDLDRVRLHHRGYDSDEQAQLDGERLLSGSTKLEGSSVLVTDVASASHSYGVLAALAAPGTRFFPTERRTLQAYGRHAAAALEIVASLEDARRDRDTAQALLGLAGELAAVGSGSEIAARLVACIPTVTQCDVASLWRWEEKSQRLALDARFDLGSERTVTRDYFGVGDLPELVDADGGFRPVWLSGVEGPSPLRELFDQLGLVHGAVVPIAAHGSFLGILAAGFRREVPDDESPRLLSRLHGLADHAAMAMENAALVEDIRRQARHDALTGLPNRTCVEDRANEHLAAAAGTGASTALLFIDLDRFKNVNDTLGHSAGDDLIRQVTGRLQMFVDSTGTLARLGGDEFVVLLPDLPDLAKAIEVGQRVVRALDQPFSLAGREVFISCSIGIACAPQHGEDYGSLLRHADAAMYEAKAHGRNTVAVHVASTGADRREQLDLETALHKAVENDELRVAYQPQVSVLTTRVIGVEALVRWQHPTLGLLEPEAFLQLAEDTGLIVEIDRWLRRTALAQASRWSRHGRPIRVAMNLSSRDLRDPDLAAIIRGEIKKSGVDPALVELEITDRVVLSERDLARALHDLKRLGVRLAIDDFGTGTSVLGRLQRCPIDTLKIDRSFVAELGPGKAEALVVKALIDLGHSLELTVVAEGVEDASQLAALTRYGCDLAQGFLLGAPMAADAIDALMEERARTLIKLRNTA